MTAGIAPLAGRPAPRTLRDGRVLDAVTDHTMGRLLLPAEARAEVRVHGLQPEPFDGTPAGMARVLVHAGRREMAVARVRLRPPRSHAYPRVQRWPAPTRRDGAIARVVRAAAGGVVVQVAARPGTRSLLDVLLVDAGVRGGDVRLQSTREGGVVAAVDTVDGPAILRVGTIGASSDPVTALRALELLTDGALGLAPRPLRDGQIGRLRWTVERRLPGRPARRLDRGQVARLASVWTELPASPGPARAVVGDLVRIALLVPRHTRHIRNLMAQIGPPRLPGVLRHGDLWHGNVLVEDGCVTGVIDWGSWHRFGTPGADLLHLVALLDRRRGETLGALWCREPWTWPDFRRLVTPMLDAHGVTPTPEVLEHIGLAWWASAVAGTLTRLPRRAYDEAWLGDNVTAVLRTRWV